MNQILYVEKSKNKTSVDINTIARISAIIILIFAIFAIGKGVFGIVDESNNKNLSEPTVEIREVEDELELKITFNKVIDKIVYSWNSGSEYTLQGKGRKEIVETIALPVGTNILNIKITDIDKKMTTYTKQYYKEETVDTTNPRIALEKDGSKVKILVTDDKELKSVSYHWNNEDETVLTPNENYKKQIEESITVLKGENELTIVAIDAAGNEQTKKQKIRGAKSPTIELSYEGSDMIIKVKDEENIKKIELTINGEFFSTDSEGTGANLNMQEAEIRQKLPTGRNEIIITAYNVSGLSVQKNDTKTIE